MMQDCLRGRPSAAHVLAIKVVEPDYNNYLQQACYIIRDAFAKAGLMADGDQKRELMLHATLMSTSIRRRATKKSFDARKILAKYRLQDWGERTIQEVHLSQRFLFDEDGYYHRCGSFPLPSAVPQASA
ncbi:hypothetical protein L7F22_034854 [Adiantum nelumboides]|nr:hypothetical protein [Adiantum nelumboides]